MREVLADPRLAEGVGREGGGPRAHLRKHSTVEAVAKIGVSNGAWTLDSRGRQPSVPAKFISPSISLYEFRHLIVWRAIAYVLGHGRSRPTLGCQACRA